MLRRSEILGLFVAAAIALSPVAARASSPQANGNGSLQASDSAGLDAPGTSRGSEYCVTAGGFLLRVADPSAQAAVADYAGNQNGMVCVKILPTPDNAAAHVVVIEDRASSQI